MRFTYTIESIFVVSANKTATILMNFFKDNKHTATSSNKTSYVSYINCKIYKSQIYCVKHNLSLTFTKRKMKIVREKKRERETKSISLNHRHTHSHTSTQSIEYLFNLCTVSIDTNDKNNNSWCKMIKKKQKLATTTTTFNQNNHLEWMDEMGRVK